MRIARYHSSFCTLSVADPFEQSLLTPANFPQFNKIVQVIKDALAAHYATMAPAKDQMVTLPIAELCPWFVAPFVFARRRIFINIVIAAKETTLLWISASATFTTPMSFIPNTCFCISIASFDARNFK